MPELALEGLEIKDRLKLALELLDVKPEHPVHLKIDVVESIHKYSGAMQNDELAKASFVLLNELTTIK